MLLDIDLHTTTLLGESLVRQASGMSERTTAGGSGKDKTERKTAGGELKERESGREER